MSYLEWESVSSKPTNGEKFSKVSAAKSQWISLKGVLLCHFSGGQGSRCEESSRRSHVWPACLVGSTCAELICKHICSCVACQRPPLQLVVLLYYHYYYWVVLVLRTSLIVSLLLPVLLLVLVPLRSTGSTSTITATSTSTCTSTTTSTTAAVNIATTQYWYYQQLLLLLLLLLKKTSTPQGVDTRGWGGEGAPNPCIIYL